MKITGCEYGVYAAANTGGVLQLYKWNISATDAAIFSDKTSGTKILLQESAIASGKVQLQGGTLLATDNDFNNTAPQIQFEYNSRGNLTGNRFKNAVNISEKSVFLNQIDHTPVSSIKLPAYYEFIPQSKKPSRNVMYNVLNYGVTAGTRDAIPAGDATTGIQNALNQAKNDGGGIVYLPPGHYRINGSLTIPTGVELKGSVDIGEFPLGPGSILEIYGNKGNENGASPVILQQGSGLRGVVFNYPDQVFCTVLPNAVLKFPYSVQVQGSDAYIVNVGFRAAYKAVDLFSYKSDRFYLDFLTGHVFNEGAKVGAASADGIIANMQFNTIAYNCGDESKFGGWPNSLRSPCSGDATKNPYDYNAKYLDFLIVGNAPDIMLYNDFNYDANHGLILQDGASGTAIGLGLDGDRTGILVDGNANFSFINTQDVSLNYDALGGEQSSYLKTTSNFNAGSINLFSCDYWGQATSSGIVMDGAGTVNLQSSNFESPGSQSFAQVNNGTLNINNSVVNPKDPLVNGTHLSGVNIVGSDVTPYTINTNLLGNYDNNIGTAKPSPTSSLSRTGWIATSSRNVNSGRVAQNGIDGDANTSWSSGWQNDGAAIWYQVDMLVPQTFNEVILDYSGSPNDGPASYTFSVSNDGVNWTQVASGTGNNMMTIISFPETTARYIRMDKPANASKANFLAIHELYVFNVKAAAGNLVAVPMKNPLYHQFTSPLYGSAGTGNMYTADPSAHVWADGRLYVYASHDMEPAQGCDRMDRYHVFSTDDMTNWVDHGEILSASQVSWGRAEGGFMWAPDCAYNPANQTYYFYYPHPSGTDWGATWKIGVATSKEPAANFTDQGYITGMSSLIDPCVFVDDDGQPYIYQGGGGTCMGGKLDKNDWTKLDGAMQPMTGLVDFHEATWVHKYNGKYYLSHADNHGVDGNQLKYAVSNSPLGPWTDMGVLMYATGCDTHHGSIVEYKGQWWSFYHTSNFSGEYNLRSVCADKLYYNNDGSIQPVNNWGTAFKSNVVAVTNNTTDVALTVEAEDFNNGGSHYGYWDKTDANSGGNNSRSGEGVDIETRGNVVDIGWIENGEWLRYTVNVTKAGLYDIDFTVAAGNTGGKFHLSVNGTNLSGDLTVPNTGDWGNWTTVTALNIPLQAGEQYIDLRFNGGFNLDKFQFRKSAPYQGTAYNGPHNVPGTFEAEDYDNGGTGVAYYDSDVANNSGAYRTTEGVDLETSNGSTHISWSNSGEWTKYTIVVATDGTYEVQIPVSTGNGAAGTLSLTFDDVYTVPVASINTGNWNTYQSLTIKDIQLTAGTHVMKLNIGGNINVDQFTFTKSITTAMPEATAQHHISIYPNPSADGIFNIKATQQGQLIISDVAGKMVLSEIVAEPGNIDLSGRASGIYIATFITGEQTYRFKLMVNK
ncbi:MAG: family 43 glycosylhydrolase [Flavobacteriales bacterium]